MVHNNSNYSKYCVFIWLILWAGLLSCICLKWCTYHFSRYINIVQPHSLKQNPFLLPAECAVPHFDCICILLITTTTGTAMWCNVSTLNTWIHRQLWGEKPRTKIAGSMQVMKTNTFWIDVLLRGPAMDKNANKRIS